MKKGYVKPAIEIEDFALTTAIAAGCQTTVTLGPGDATHEVCDEYNQSPWSLRSYARGSDPIDQPFYEDSCSCYLSSAGGTLLTS